MQAVQLPKFCIRLPQRGRGGSSATILQHFWRRIWLLELSSGVSC